MKTEKKIIIFLLLISPILGELLTASTPPLNFFNPFGLIYLTLLYGCGTLFIREAKVRWGLQWSVVFLAAAYGIIEEGTMIQSFFNLSHEDLGHLSGYGMYFGVQWPWTIMLTLFHGTISTLVPITIAELLWPEYANKPLLRKKGLILNSIGFIFVIALWMIFAVERKIFPAYANYNSNNVLIFSSIAFVFLLILLAHKYRESRISTKKFKLFSPFVFGVAGFLFQIINLFLPNILVEFHVSGATTILAQIILVIMVLLFVVHQIYNQSTTKRHIASLVFGSILFWILLTPAHEFGVAENPDPAQGMLVVGIISLILLISWKRYVLKK